MCTCISVGTQWWLASHLLVERKRVKRERALPTSVGCVSFWFRCDAVKIYGVFIYTLKKTRTRLTLSSFGALSLTQRITIFVVRGLPKFWHWIAKKSEGFRCIKREFQEEEKKSVNKKKQQQQHPQRNTKVLYLPSHLSLCYSTFECDPKGRKPTTTTMETMPVVCIQRFYFIVNSNIPHRNFVHAFRGFAKL